MSKIPAWLRWITLPIVPVITIVLVHLLGTLVGKFVLFMGPHGMNENWLTYLIVPAISAFCCVIAAGFWAPKSQELVCLIVGCICLSLMGVSTFITLFLTFEWPQLIAVVSSTAGFTVAIFQANEFINDIQ